MQDQDLTAPLRNPATASGPLRPLRMLIGGEQPLPVAFWRFGIVYGTLLNLLFTMCALAALSAGAPGWVGVAVFAIPIPYNILTAFGVWRSADAWQGPAVWPMLARLGIVGWATAASLL